MTQLTLDPPAAGLPAGLAAEPPELDEPSAGVRRAGAGPTGGRAGPNAGVSGRADPGGEPSLDAVLSGLWEGLAARRPVACPVCEGELAPFYGAHSRPVGGRCRSCGTELT